MTEPTLRRVLGPIPAAAVVAGSMVGVGIFLTPPVVARATGNLWGFFLLWLMGGVVALCGATAYAELGTMYPDAGGDYVYHRRAYGSAVAFASGSVTFAVSFAASVAALASAFVTWYLPAFLEAGGLVVDLAAPVAGTSLGVLVAVALVLLLTGVNVAGARLSGGLQTLLTAVPFGLLMCLALYGLIQRPALPPHVGGAATVGGVASAWLGVVFAYAGWPNVVYVAGEVRDPQRTLPLSMFVGTAAVTGLYLLICAAFVAVLGFDALADVGEAGSAMAAALLGPSAGLGVKVLLSVALFAATNGCILAGARVGYAMALRGGLPAAVGGVGRSGAPSVALWVQAAIAIAFLLTGGFEAILETTSLAIALVGCLSVAAVFVLRGREPEATRPYRASGYPWTLVVFLLCNGLAAVVSLVEKARAGEAGGQVAALSVLALMGAGWWLRERAARRADQGT